MIRRRQILMLKSINISHNNKVNTIMMNNRNGSEGMKIKLRDS